jgi:hypothetical protein
MLDIVMGTQVTGRSGIVAKRTIYQQKNALYPFEQLALWWLEKLLCGKDLRHFSAAFIKISLHEKSVKLA